MASPAVCAFFGVRTRAYDPLLELLETSRSVRDIDELRRVRRECIKLIRGGGVVVTTQHIHYGIERAHPAIFETLLQSFDLNTAVFRAASPLALATANCRFRHIAKLVKHGARRDAVVAGRVVDDEIKGILALRTAYGCLVFPTAAQFEAAYAEGLASAAAASTSGSTHAIVDASATASATAT
jgi:hypothetical protein